MASRAVAWSLETKATSGATRAEGGDGGQNGPAARRRATDARGAESPKEGGGQKTKNNPGPASPRSRSRNFDVFARRAGDLCRKILPCGGHCKMSDYDSVY